MADVFDILQRDHDEVSALLEHLAVGPAASTGASEEELRLRKRLTDQLITEEARHEAAEDEYIWPVVRERVPDGNLLADQAATREQHAKKIRASLRKLSATDDEFDRLLIQYARDGRAHISYQETQVWPQLRQVLSQDEADDLARKLEQAAEKRPRRPAARRRVQQTATPRRGQQGARIPVIPRTTGAAVTAADTLHSILTGPAQG